MKLIVMLLTFVYLALICQPYFRFADYTVWLFVDTFTFAWRVLLLIYFCVFIIAIWMLIMHALGLWNT